MTMHTLRNTLRAISLTLLAVAAFHGTASAQDRDAGSLSIIGRVSTDPGGLVSTDPGGLVSTDPGGLVSTDPGGLVSTDIGGLISISDLHVIQRTRTGLRVAMTLRPASRWVRDAVLTVRTHLDEGTRSSMLPLSFDAGREQSVEILLPLPGARAAAVVGGSAWLSRSGLTAGIILELAQTR